MKFTRVLAVAAASFGLVITASPAHAAIHRHGDAMGDVRQFSCEDMFDEESCVETGTTAVEPDIASIAIRNGLNNVVVRIKQRDITRGGIRGHDLRIYTNEGLTRWVGTVATPGSAQLEKEMTKPNGDEVRCSKLAAVMDHVNNMVTITVPRSCLSYPGWVRVGIGAWTLTADGEYVRLDDAFLNGRVSDNLVLSPLVRRG